MANRSFVLRSEILPAVRVAWPCLEEGDVTLNAVGIELGADNALVSFEGYGETAEGEATDFAYEASDIPAASQRALVALALVYGDACAANEGAHDVVAALRGLLNYTGGWDITDASHPIFIARAALAKAETR